MQCFGKILNLITLITTVKLMAIIEYQNSYVTLFNVHLSSTHSSTFFYDFYLRNDSVPVVWL